MGKPARSKDQPASIPDHPEFWFLREYPPLTAEQHKELAEVVKTFHKWQELFDQAPRSPSVERDEEVNAFFDMVTQLNQFRATQGFNRLPSNRMAALRHRFRQEFNPLITMAHGSPPDRYKAIVGEMWQAWWDHLDAITYPPPPMPDASNEAEALAAAATLLHALDELESRQGRSTDAPGKQQKAKAAVSSNEGRDRWLYKQVKAGKLTYKQIMFALKKTAPAKGWVTLGSPQAVEQAVNRHIKRNGLPRLPPRQEG